MPSSSSGTTALIASIQAHPQQVDVHGLPAHRVALGLLQHHRRRLSRRRRSDPARRPRRPAPDAARARPRRSPPTRRRRRTALRARGPSGAGAAPRASRPRRGSSHRAWWSSQPWGLETLAIRFVWDRRTQRQQRDVDAREEVPRAAHPHALHHRQPPDHRPRQPGVPVELVKRMRVRRFQRQDLHRARPAQPARVRPCARHACRARAAAGQLLRPCRSTSPLTCASISASSSSRSTFSTEKNLASRPLIAGTAAPRALSA